MLLASVSTDIAKVWLDRRGWDRASRLLERFGLVAPEGWRRNATALGLLVANGILDFRMRDDTPVRRFAKEILRDMPSELLSRYWKDQPSPDASVIQRHKKHPLFALDMKDLKTFLARVNTIPRHEQERLRTLLADLQTTDLAALAAATPEEFSTMLTLLVPPEPKRRPRPRRMDRFLSRAALVLVPFLR
jgi:hypothetical protein